MGYSPYAFSTDLINSSSLAGQSSLNDCIALKRPRSRMLVSGELGDCVYTVRFRAMSSTGSLISSSSSRMCGFAPSCCNWILTEFRPSLNSCGSHSCDVRQFRSLYTKNRWVISVMGSPIDVGEQYPFITFFTPPIRLSGKFLLWCDEAGTLCE